jgi:Protein of Unknown function (DUF2604)
MPPVDRPDRHLDLVVVVSGQPQPVRMNANQKLEHLVREALQRSGNAGQPPADWELRTEAGALLDQQARAAEAGLVDGMTLFLNPRAGAGGSR